MAVRKRLLCVFLVLLLVVAEVYVGTISVSEREKALLDAVVTKDTITIWYTDETLADYINSVALRYYEDTDIRVETMFVEEEEYLETVNQASIRGAGPDLFIIGNDNLEMAYLAGLAGEVTDPHHTFDTNAFSQTALNAATYNYKLVAYPFYFEESVLLYNKTHLFTVAEAELVEQMFGGTAVEDEELSEEELESMGRKMTGSAEEADTVFENDAIEYPPTLAMTSDVESYLNEASKRIVPTSIKGIIEFADSYIAPSEVRSIFKWDVNDIFYNYFFIGNYMNLGGECGDDYNEIDLYNTDTLACMSVYKQLNQFFSIDADDVDYDRVLEEFMNGEIIFTVVTTDAVAKLDEAREEGKFKYEYGIAPMPDLTEELKGRGMSKTECIAINGYSEHKAYANEFAEYLTYNCADSFYERTGKFACRSDIKTGNPNIGVIYEEYSRTIPMPKLMRIANFWIQLEICFSRVWRGEETNIWLQYLGQQVLSQLNGNKVVLDRIDDVDVDLGIRSDIDI